MSYDQAMKHWKNHRKDRYFQQCSFASSGGGHDTLTESKAQELSKTSIAKIIETVHDYPLFIRQYSIGVWSIVPKNDLFGTKIESEEELKFFAKEYA